MADLLRPEGYEPKEQFSPSGLGLASLCEMAWFFRYVLGMKESDLLDWSEVAHLTRPTKPDRGPNLTALQLAAHREDVKEFNRLTRRALGHAVHGVLAIHYEWHPPLSLIDWTDRPGYVAITGLPFLPAHEDCKEICVEQQLELAFGPDDDPVKVWGFADLIVQLLEQVHKSDVKVYAPGAWVLLDYKTTYNFDYVPLQAELEQDVAACFYALAVMVKLNLPELVCRWVYFLTDEKKPEDSRAVTFTITRAMAIETLTPVEALALKLRMVMRKLVRTYASEKAALATGLKHNPVHCANMFGSPCVYHHEQGGDCRPPQATSGQRLVHLRRKEEVLAKRREFQRGLTSGKPSTRRRHRDARNEQRPQPAQPGRARNRNAAPAAVSARHVTTVNPQEKSTDMAGKFDAAPTDGPPASPPATRTRAPRAAKPAAAAPAADSETPTLYLSGVKPAEGMSIEVPQGSPLYDRNLAFINAAFAD